MLGQSFCAGLILAKGVSWLTLPAVAAVLATFLAREPIVFLLRQKFVWKNPNPDTPTAQKLLLGYAVLLAASGAALLSRLPVLHVFGLGGPAMLMLGAGAWLTMKNRQRSLWFQAVSACGLNGSALLSWVSVRWSFDWPIFLLWAALSAHAIAAVLVVHAHLDTRIAAKRQQESPVPKAAWSAQAGLLAGAVVCVVCSKAALAIPLMVSASVHAWNLYQVKSEAMIAVPLRTIGWRAMGLGILVALTAVKALWAQP